MNFSIIKRTLGWLLIFEAIFMLVPTATAFVYEEWSAMNAIVASIGACLLVGLLCLIGKVKNDSLYAKEGMVIVASSWIVLSLFGALPFWFSREIPSYIDALFESASGFTTTGATILTGEGTADGYLAMSKSLLMWRSFTHWVGGMGVLVFIMAFLRRAKHAHHEGGEPRSYRWETRTQSTYDGENFVPDLLLLDGVGIRLAPLWEDAHLRCVEHSVCDGWYGRFCH